MKFRSRCPSSERTGNCLSKEEGDGKDARSQKPAGGTDPRRSLHHASHRLSLRTSLILVWPNRRSRVLRGTLT